MESELRHSHQLREQIVQSVRVVKVGHVAVFQRRLVIALLLTGSGLLYAISGSLVVADAGGLLLATFVWVGMTLVDRATYRSKLFDADSVQRGLLVECYWIEDADGTRHRGAVLERGRRHVRLSNANGVQLLSVPLAVACDTSHRAGLKGARLWAKAADASTYGAQRGPRAHSLGAFWLFPIVQFTPVKNTQKTIIPSRRQGCSSVLRR